MSTFFRLPLVAAIAAIVSLSAQATTTNVAANQWYEFAISDSVSQSGGTEWIDMSDNSALSFSFTIAQGYMGSLTVVDTGYAGDTFKVFNGNTLLGFTSSVPVGIYPDAPGIVDPEVALLDSGFSRATFALGAGDYVIKGVLSQSVLLDAGGAPLNATSGNLRLAVAAVPEPETLAMLLAGLGFIGFATRRRA